MRRSSASGTDAAPTYARRSDDRSVRARSGWSRSDVHSVGGPGDHAHPLPLDGAERLAGFEGGNGERGRAGHEAEHPPGLVAEAVEERRDDEIAVAVAEAEVRTPALERAQALRVGEQHALGTAGRSRREHDVGDVVTVDRVDPRDRGVFVDRVAAGEERGERLGVCVARHPTASPSRHDAASSGSVRVQQLDVVDPEEAVDGEQHASAALPQHVRGFVAFEPRVDRYQPRAGAEDAERGDDELEAVRGPDRNAVAGLRCQRPSPRASRRTARSASSA